MGVIMGVLGGIILAYWGYSMSVDRFERPRWVHEYGPLFPLAAIALIVGGFFV